MKFFLQKGMDTCIHSLLQEKFRYFFKIWYLHPGQAIYLLTNALYHLKDGFDISFIQVIV
jgi:hypothetical protein